MAHLLSRAPFDANALQRYSKSTLFSKSKLIRSAMLAEKNLLLCYFVVVSSNQSLCRLTPAY